MATATVKPDRELQKDIIHELRWDPRVDATEVGVQVDRGIVTLTGRIESYARKIAAKEATHRVAGVLDVVNNLVVVPSNVFERTDQDLARAVRNALEWDVLVPDTRIHSTVSEGWVTLEGEVDRWSQRYDAERAVERLTGVKGVNNEIRICVTAHPDSHDLRDSIEQALDRQAHREADRIKIATHNGVVTLSGAVRSWAEKNAIHNVVSYAPGVQRVDDRLIVDPYK